MPTKAQRKAQKRAEIKEKEKLLKVVTNQPGKDVSTNPTQPKKNLENSLVNHINSAHEKAMGLEEKNPTIEPIGQKPNLPAVLDETVLQEAWNKVNEAITAYEGQKKRYERTESETKAEKEKYMRQEQTLQDRSEELNIIEKNLKVGEKKLRENENALQAREEEVLKKEIEAETGYVTCRKEWQANLDALFLENREEIEKLYKQQNDKRLDDIKEFGKKSEEIDELLKNANIEKEKNKEAAKLEIQEEKQQLEEAKRENKKWENRLRVREEELDEDRQAMQEKIDRKAALQVESLNGELQEKLILLEAARADRNRLYEDLNKKDQAMKRFGDRSPEDVLEEIDRLKKGNDALHEQIATQPSGAEIERLKQVEREKTAWETERDRLLQKNNALTIQQNIKDIAVMELETLRDQNRALEYQNKLLSSAVEELGARVDSLTQRAKDAPVFPACSKMDQLDDPCQEEPDLDERAIDLEEFAEDLRNRIGYNPASEEKITLYYSIEDTRAFLGGLAMSKLHLFQGISGTGKTSLPIAFARAVGGKHARIEVQAGWRDREDLIGHFNAFEGKYYEKPLLTSLYEAQTPAYKDRIYVIVLDEMNLSHPEQYFADFISALEVDPSERILHLNPDPLPSAPTLFMNGKDLKIPSNTWFIGTANHDDTTNRFAPKTVDRAFVLELPQHRKEQEVDTNMPARAPIALATLTDAFKKAQAKYKDEAKESYKFLTDTFKEPLGKRFRIGWGNRLERQVDLFVPVMIAAGSPLSEAIDFILATKILFKTRDRMGNRPNYLTDLRSTLLSAWNTKGFEDKPGRSLEVINSELQRLGESTDD